jgi:hypothetical protein
VHSSHPCARVLPSSRTAHRAVVGVGLVLAAMVVSACGGSGDADSTTTSSTLPEITATTGFVPGTLADSFVDNYRSDELGFSIGFPVDWEVDEDFERRVVGFFARPVPEDTFRENYTVVAGALESGVTPEDLARVDAARVTGIDGYTPVGGGETSLDGEPALTVVFDGVAEGVELRFFRLITVHEGRSYEFAFIANRDEFENFVPVLDQMLATFRFED